MLLRWDEQLQQTRLALEHADKRYNSSNFEWHAWPQQWSNSGCGRSGGGLVMHAFWMAQTVITSGDSDEVLVYHNGHFAYEVKKPLPAFWIACGERKLPGERDWPTVGHTFDATMNPPPTADTKAKKKGQR